MPAPLSVVIPTLDAAASLPDCLAPLVEGVSAGLIGDLVITDGGSADATLQIARDVGAHIVSGPPSRGGQLRRGVAACRGAWVLVLHADTVLRPGWAEIVNAHITGPHPRAAFFRLRFDAGGAAPRLVAAWANLRARRLGLPYGDQGLLIARSTYDAVGGYRDIPVMEDVALARALKGRLTGLPVTAVTSAARYQRDGWLRRGARNLMLLGRFMLGADPVRLARKY